MQGVMTMLRRFIGATMLLSLLLMAFNLVLLGTIVFSENKQRNPESVVREVAEQLVVHSDGFRLAGPAEKLLDEHEAWAMLLDSKGKIAWEYKLPKQLPRTYSLVDVAKFSRNYLLDYPVFIWEKDTGLLVLGYPQHTYAKYQVSYFKDWIQSLPVRIVLLLVCNLVLFIVLSVCLGAWCMRSIKPLVSGIHGLTKQEPVQVKAKSIFRDLADSINAASRMLQEQNRALKARDEARSNWIAGISHDVRTPLSMILGYASDLEDHSALPLDQQQQAGIIRRQGEKLRSLIHDLNLVSMLEYEMQPLSIKEVRASAIVRQVASDFLNQGVDTNRYTIELELNDEKIKVRADEKLLLRAASNLVQNSITHNPQGCRIIIRTEWDRERSVYRLIVSDNGQGAERSELPDLLKLPYSSSRKRTRKHGHGLGLPMVARIAAAHGGRLLLESGINEGFQATLELPSFVPGT
ncbi:sensor histidine kinase KdpD [Paenibacillus macerans]|uniref:sensor histidine kinase n=1 Tax=Paenibacillus macerans TaxID=44252 RepID=UPI00203F406E|nr:HAMP domain-containing sensor histidine kinase [Paenibacillus macerans]MCM3701179.1 HAMP domain-containing histidine kinase [Paenibacillus macerans]